jgi:hypothetical protein
MLKRKVIRLVTAGMCAAACLSVGTANANIITTFDVNALFDSSCPGCTLGGNIVIDVATVLYNRQTLR